MAQTAVAPVVEVPSIPLGQIAPWAVFFGLLATLVIFFISADQGAVSIPAGNGDPRVGPRRTSPARLPLPLSPPPPVRREGRPLLSADPDVTRRAVSPCRSDLS